MAKNTTDDRLTIAALGVLAMCLTTIDHEVIGHGSACLIGGGEIVHISTTLFACTRPSPWVAAGGPFFDLFAGLAAWLIGRTIPAQKVDWRLFFAAMTAFSLFWESGYLVKAMLGQDGDLYFFARAMLGQPEMTWRIIGGAIGAVIFLATIRISEANFLAAIPNAGRARSAARTIWVVASVGAIVAALAFKGDFWSNLRDAALEIGLAACPLLLIARRGPEVDAPVVARNWAVIGFAACLFIVFAATIGHGLGSFS